MRIVVAVVGKPRDSALASAISDYETRAARYWPLEVYEVREERGKLSTPEIVQRESARLMEKIPSGAKLVACDSSGDLFTSEEFSHWLQGEREAARDVAFVIGGAYGISPGLRGKAVRRLSMGKWTLPHEVARLVLAEQLYRAGTIVRGEPYHKA